MIMRVRNIKVIEKFETDFLLVCLVIVTELIDIIQSQIEVVHIIECDIHFQLMLQKIWICTFNG